MIQQITTMLELQDAMNTKVHADWREQGFAWYRAIWVECAELMDHYGWKWWKKQTPDSEQVKLELVDIWHFGLSILLLGDSSESRIAAAVADAFGGARPGEDFRRELESFTLATLESRHFDVARFGTLMHCVDLSFDELFARYIGKNVLNFFRQDNGYQQGTYLKNWQGKEDNEHLVEIVAELDRSSTSFKEDVYRALEVRYQAALAG